MCVLCCVRLCLSLVFLPLRPPLSSLNISITALVLVNLGSTSSQSLEFNVVEVEWGVATAGEIGSTPLAAEILDVSLDAAFAVADESVDLVIGDAEEVAKRIETGETGGAALFLASSSALALGVGLHLTLDWTGLQAQALAAVWAILG